MSDETQPGDRLARIEAKLELIAKSVIIPEVEAPFDAPASGEFKRTPTGTMEFETKGPFWRNAMIFAWQRASKTNRVKLIIGAFTGQGLLLWLAQSAKHSWPAIRLWLIAHVG